MTERLGAIVLAGGRSSRMGAPKAWLELDGETLLARTCRVLGSLASTIVVAAAPAQSLPALDARVRVVRDAVEGEGPLRGIVTGLGALDGAVEAAFVTTTDAPFLVPELVLRLAALRDGADASIPRAFGADHPLSAVYAVRVRAAAEELLARNVRRARSLGEAIEARYVSAELLLEDRDLLRVDPALDSLRSVNTPAEYAAALARPRS